MGNRLVRLVLILLPLMSVAEVRADSASLDAYLAERVETTRIPGLVAMVVDADDVLYTAAAGWQDASRRVPMAENSIFRIASMTKPVAAAAIMMLVEEGKLSLDEPIARYISEFADPVVIESFDAETGEYSTRPASGEITIRQLLSHSSGLAYGFGSDAIARISAGGAAVSARTQPLLYDPGTAWSYAGGIAEVATVLERIEGVSLDTFLRERLFAPLGMSETSYIVPLGSLDRVVTVHRLENGVLVETPNPNDIRSQVSGDGGLHTTAADYAKFMRLFLNDGVAADGTRLLSPSAVRELTSNQLGAVRVSLQDEPLPNLARAFPLGADRDGFGLGFQVTGAHDASTERAPGSLSWAGIFNTEFWIDPASGIGGILLMQYLPFYDEEAIETLVGFEQRVYGWLHSPGGIRGSL